MLGLWVAMDSTLGKVIDFVCGSKSIKAASELFNQVKRLPTMAYSTVFIKTLENLISTALHQQGKTFTTRSNHLKIGPDLTGEFAPKNAVLQ